MSRATRSPRRTVLLVLHALALGGCLLVIREIAADTEVRAVTAAPHREPNLVIEPGEWVFGDAGLVPGKAPASAPRLTSAMPAECPRVAVRVCPAGRVTAELYGPVNLPEVVAAWRAAGWKVTEPPASDRPRYALHRDGDAVVAWPLHTKPGGPCHLLITQGE